MKWSSHFGPCLMVQMFTDMLNDVSRLIVLENVPDSPNFPEIEVAVLNLWKEKDAFKTSLKLSEGRKEYTFYDGPPFATGLPHYGHILAGNT